MNLRFSILGAAVAMLLASCATPTPQAHGPAAAGGPFRLGVDVLAGNNWDLLRGKRVGLICNQTSMTAAGITTRSAMKRGGVNLVALYAPEHGIDGTIKAGVHVRNARDGQTGLPVYSLYGDTRKPT
ncbi:MAG: exo-beta-N-acetylmuramidase NamZ domain-containing protein, partial [Roseimicrobium sp.]